MKTAELLKERYPNHIANEYAESRELSLAKFDGHDMIEFAEYYHQQKIAEVKELDKEIIAQIKEEIRVFERPSVDNIVWMLNKLTGENNTFESLLTQEDK